MDESDLIRELLSDVSGFAPQEFYENKECTSCSGQGACYALVNKSSADQITKKRLVEAKEKSIKTVVTQCPTCVYKMQQSQKTLDVKDVISFINDCIE